MRKSLKYLLLFPLLSVILVNCDEEESLKPIKVETGVVISVDYESATVTGEIIEFGIGIEAFGHCWSTNPIPSVSDEKTTVIVEVDGDFQSEIKELKDEEKYYFRSYALNEDEVVYGEIKEFTTELHPLKIGLVAYYPFDEDINDYSGNGNNATNYGADLTLDRFGNENSAYYFDGLNDYMQLTNSINFTDGLSFSFWVNSQGAQTNENGGAIICKYAMGSDISRNFNINSFGAYDENVNNRIAVAFYNTRYTYDVVHSDWILESIPENLNSALYTFENPKEIILNKWSFIVINLTQTELEIWIDGILTVKKTREFNTYANDANQPIYIGNNLSGGDGDNNHFHGKLDDLRIYNASLTEDEIQELYHEGGWNN